MSDLGRSQVIGLWGGAFLRRGQLCLNQSFLKTALLNPPGMYQGDSLKTGLKDIKIMISKKVEQILSEVSRIIPDDVQNIRQDIENNLRASLTASLARLDLVTREEFDVQTALLQRARAQLDRLEEKLAAMEKQRVEEQGR